MSLEYLLTAVLFVLVIVLLIDVIGECIGVPEVSHLMKRSAERMRLQVAERECAQPENTTKIT